jgi:dTDP-4-dehydrorhamnose 3,5-epimerase
MKIVETDLTGVLVVETNVATDERGAFTRFYCGRELASVMGSRRIVQINHSRTDKIGAVRGLHYQHPPHAEMKIVRCLQGAVWDVTLDLRAGSPTFLQWRGEELTPDNARMMIIPEGCAHGFQVLKKGSELLYLHTAYYSAGSEGGLSYNDPRLGIAWPLPVSELSRRDSNHPPLTADYSGLVL